MSGSHSTVSLVGMGNDWEEILGTSGSGLQINYDDALNAVDRQEPSADQNPGKSNAWLDKLPAADPRLLEMDIDEIFPPN